MMQRSVLLLEGAKPVGPCDSVRLVQAWQMGAIQDRPHQARRPSVSSAEKEWARGTARRKDLEARVRKKQLFERDFCQVRPPFVLSPVFYA